MTSTNIYPQITPYVYMITHKETCEFYIGSRHDFYTKYPVKFYTVHNTIITDRGTSRSGWRLVR